MPMRISLSGGKLTNFEPTSRSTVALGPTIFHITMHKAGSQWIRHLLSKCAPDLIVQPTHYTARLLKVTVKEGYIYPAAYITKWTFNRLKKPRNSRHFVILRDLRDVLVSAYFSFKITHPEVERVASIRKALNAREVEAGMLWLLKGWLRGEAKISSSWIDNRKDWIRYEDLLKNDLGILEEVLIDRCNLDIDRALFGEHVLSCRFSRVSGRTPGQEDFNSHYRKGVAGDWRNHFTPKIKRAFKWRYGSLLLKSGYEKNHEW
jgi:hypothetical protein